MRIGWGWLPLVLVLGCAHSEKSQDFSPVPGPSQSTVTLPTPPIAPPAPQTNSTPRKPQVVTPDTSLTGKVMRFNPGSRIVVLQFPIVSMPAVGTPIFLYRNNLKVGEAKVTGPQKGEHTVADLLNGETQVGDVARDR